MAPPPPPAGNGQVLVTTRDGNPATWGPWCHLHHLSTLPAGQAAAMLTDHARHHPAPGSDDDARALAQRLGGLPLALKIAGTYLAETTTTPAAFAGPAAIRTYQDYHHALDAGGPAAVFPAPTGDITPGQARELIGATWDLTLDLLTTRDLPEARPLLQLLAAFAKRPSPPAPPPPP